MKYIHKKTGFIIDATSKLLGDWTPYDSSLKRKIESIEDLVVEEEPQVAEVSEEQIGDADFDSITKPQIMQELDAFGIKYDKRATKQVLYDLMMSQGK